MFHCALFTGGLPRLRNKLYSVMDRSVYAQRAVLEKNRIFILKNQKIGFFYSNRIFFIYIEITYSVSLKTFSLRNLP